MNDYDRGIWVLDLLTEMVILNDRAGLILVSRFLSATFSRGYFLSGIHFVLLSHVVFSLEFIACYFFCGISHVVIFAVLFAGIYCVLFSRGIISYYFLSWNFFQWILFLPAGMPAYRLFPTGGTIMLYIISRWYTFLRWSMESSHPCGREMPAGFLC